MRLCIQILLIFGTFIAKLSANPQKIPLVTLTYDQYIKMFDKQPDSLKESVYNFNLNRINQHNELYNNGKVDFFLGINQFTDMSDEEFENSTNKQIDSRNIKNDAINKKHTLKTRQASNETNVDRYDWREKGAVTTVKSQGDVCQSCSAFAVIAALEAQYFKLTGKLVSFSEQYLVDCGNTQEICKTGGISQDHYEFLKTQKGLPTADSYSYVGRKGNCRSNYDLVKFKVISYETIASTESDLIDAITNKGPISISIYMPNIYKQYKGGILNDSTICTEKVNHAVSIVGFDRDSYIIRNSWGDWWGEKGYFRLSRKHCTSFNHNFKPMVPNIKILKEREVDIEVEFSNDENKKEIIDIEIKLNNEKTDESVIKVEDDELEEYQKEFLNFKGVEIEPGNVEMEEGMKFLDLFFNKYRI